MKTQNENHLSSVLSALRTEPPKNRKQLKGYIKTFLGVSLPDKSLSGAASPFDYLWHAYSTELEGRPNGDCLVWANRGGGKTLCGAVLTVLDAVLRPGCSIKILSGSQEQARRMYEYAARFMEEGFPDMLSGKITKSSLRLENSSSVEVLTQSSRNVRGRHIHKLRCDEIELFDPEVYQAAQYITKSGNGITSAMEAASTMHEPYGIMSEAVSTAKKACMPVFRWNLWDVIEKCTERTCSSCPLWEDCRGIAKDAGGYYRIDDAVSQMNRASRSSWESEMLCRKPSASRCVFPSFERSVNVCRQDFSAARRLFRSIDFGFVNPFVCLWIEQDSAGNVFVIKEYVARQKTAAVNCENVRKLTPKTASLAGTFCDPAGSQTSQISGTSVVSEFRKQGINLRWKASRIAPGLEMIRQHIRNAAGRPRLFIDRSCVNLIEAMESYHYPAKCTGDELPEKDGIYDHYIDALRYFFVNLESDKGFVAKY
ncbi:Bacteriophage terminase large (ATPase) subunit [Sedimentisphaera cyanobacteriorum]|uniref:Bacteriophage terminase large (ATPase) subunit n=1 Tax=Sedimentisphaera cyanobacteriorum TaxID=1940790 RepID=A0A1Q2HRB0_9BACT|nr:hypothetical protein [Sedimentisphaera cyanobacteriorum]AQQ09763.1 Bacteriophage terminase large (ATPase) subunit [Sedimentisphaera cyanobacteriorum]